MVRRVAALCALGVVPALAGCDRGRSDDLSAARSPDGRIVISAGLARGGVLSVRVRRDGADLILPSPVGLTLAGEPAGATVIVSRSRRLLDLELRAMTGRGGETLAITESGIEDFAAAYLTGIAPSPPRSACPHPAKREHGDERWRGPLSRAAADANRGRAGRRRPAPLTRSACRCCARR